MLEWRLMTRELEPGFIKQGSEGLQLRSKGSLGGI
jgi:hypothetical protein